MVSRIAAIVFIFICATIAWLVLGATIFSRTFNSGQSTRDKVVSSWGSRQEQAPPEASYLEPYTHEEEVVENNKKTKRILHDKRSIALAVESSRIDVRLDLEHRQKGLLWYSVYKVAFAGEYGFRNASGEDRDVTFQLKFPADKAIYDDLQFALDGMPLDISNGGGTASAGALVPNGKTVVLKIAYRSQGLDSWRYKFGNEISQVKDFTLNARTNFKRIDFPENTLSPSEKRETPDGWALTWSYRNLVSGYQIGIEMPQKLQPGPLAGRISFFAPVSLFFFFFLMFIITTLRNIELHPMNYFFLAAAFFAFHLLLAYLVDHISIHAAFLICSAVSIFLVVSYLRLVVGIQFAAREAAAAQFVYLVLFSYAFFFEGFTGLAVTIGSIVTLFVVMQMTGRIRWSERFAARPAA